MRKKPFRVERRGPTLAVMTATEVDSPAPPCWRSPSTAAGSRGDVVLDLGNAIGLFTFPLITLHVTGSLGATGIVGLIQGLGMLIGLVPEGLLADRVERRWQ